MSLARAFTTRRARHSIERNESKTLAEPPSPQRSKTLKLRSSGSIRNKISGPVELTHTTNMLSYNAPNIFSKSSGKSSAKLAATLPSPLAQKTSDDESDKISATSTPPTSPETSFPQDRRASTPEPNHLSCYFTAPKNVEAAGKAAGSAESAAASPAAVAEAPAPNIPQRAPSHTKKPLDSITRHRSVSRLSEQFSQSSRSLSSKSSFSFSRSSSTSTSTSVSMSRTPSASHHSKGSLQHHSPTASAVPPMPSISSPTAVPAAASAVSARVVPTTATPVAPVAPVSIAASTPPISSSHKEYSETNPFGHELTQVSELVEELSKDERLHSKSAHHHHHVHMSPIDEEEERELVRRGYKKFSADDYIAEIQGLVSSYLIEVRPSAAMWI